jgi:high-affinity nickel-transport protein
MELLQGDETSMNLRHQPPLSFGERLRLTAIGLVILALHVVGFAIVWALVMPHHYFVGTKVFGLGLALTAYSLGVRHAFDADHISAIDNTTRKLINDGRRPLAVGFFFSLGHSTIVFGLSAVLAVGVSAAASWTHGPINDELGILGTLISALFLYLIATINLVTLSGIVRVTRAMWRGRYQEQELEALLDSRGVINRVLGRLMRTINREWQMYPVGVLFGLGFDTAREVALLFLAGGAAASRLPWYAILALPILFAAGMSLFDTLDGTFMNAAYGWAFAQPVRKIYYNLAVTGLSVAVALGIGTVELASVVGGELGLNGGLWGWINHFNINQAGFYIVGLFVATWLVALAIWRYGRIEERWTEQMRKLSPEEGPGL